MQRTESSYSFAIGISVLLLRSTMLSTSLLLLPDMMLQLQTVTATQECPQEQAAGDLYDSTKQCFVALTLSDQYLLSAEE